MLYILKMYVDFSWEDCQTVLKKYLGRQLHHNPIINLLMDMQVVPSSVSFTYVFVATKKGSVSIGPAHIFVNGQELASTPVKIMATTGLMAL